MGITRFIRLPGFLVLAFAAYPASASIVLYDSAGDPITPTLTCTSKVNSTSPLYVAACDTNGDGQVQANEGNPKPASMQKIWNSLNLPSGNIVLGAKYDAGNPPPNPASMMFSSGDMSLLNVSGTSESGSWSIDSSVASALLTLKWSGTYLVYLLTGGDSGRYWASPNMQISNIGLWVVPLPAAVWLFGSAIAGLFVLRRRRLAVT